MKSTSIICALLILFFPIHALEKWVNCIGNQSCYPHLYFEPSSMQELCQSIKYHALEGHKIRAVGNGYSISDIACTDGCLFNLKHLNKILSINVSEKTVRVEAGITLRDLNEKLAIYELALSNQAAITEISLGGALSTGVHGTGHTGSLSSFVKEFELITGDGNLRKISLDSDPEAFAAVSVGLGSLGVIYAVTLQCEPLFYLTKSDVTTDINYILTNYRRILDSNDFFLFLWNLETETVVVNCWNRCNLIPASTHLNKDAMSSDKALAWYTIDENDKDLFSEIAIPLTALPEAVKSIQEFFKKHRQTNAKILEITVRFVEQDAHAFLSPSTDGPVAYLAFCILEQDKYLALYKELEDILSIYNGRPHWGKLHFLNNEKVTQLYANNLQKFINVKKRLDPKDVFSNGFTDRILKSQAINSLFKF